MLPRCARALPLLGTVLACGCATLLTPRTAPLSLRTLPDSVAVRDSSGHLLGVSAGSRLRLRLRPATAQTLELGRTGWEPVRVSVGRDLRFTFALDLILPAAAALAGLATGREGREVAVLAAVPPAAMLVDLLSGAAWEHTPVQNVALAPLPAPPPPGPGTEVPHDTATAALAAALLLQGMASAADEAGCNRVVSEAWLDQADRIVLYPVSGTDSAAIERKVQARVAGARGALEALCARSNPLLDSLAVTQTASAIPPDGPAPAPDEAPDPCASAPDLARLCAAAGWGRCITFAPGSTTLAAEQAPALDALAETILSLRLPAVVVVEGTADPGGDSLRAHEAGLRRARAVADALAARGVPADRLAVESCGSEARCQLVPGAAGQARGARFNRRILLHLRLRERAP